MQRIKTILYDDILARLISPELIPAINSNHPHIYA